MSNFLYNFHPTEHFTVGVIGPPEQRIFLLQAGRGIEFVSIMAEREQMLALGEGLLSLLDQIVEAYQLPLPPQESGKDLGLVGPPVPVGSITQIWVGYDEDADRIIIIVQITVAPSESVEAARFIIDREQAQTFAYHALAVASATNAICPLCGEPIPPEGHICFKSNGHDKAYRQ